MLSNNCLSLHAAVQYVLLFLVLAVEFYLVTHSYTSHPFLCTLGYYKQQKGLRALWVECQSQCSQVLANPATQLLLTPHVSMFANNALLGGGVKVRVWIREQRKIKRRSKALLSL